MISIFAAYPENNENGRQSGDNQDTPVDHLKSSVKDVHIFNYKDLESASGPSDTPGSEV